MYGGPWMTRTLKNSTYWLTQNKSWQSCLNNENKFITLVSKKRNLWVLVSTVALDGSDFYVKLYSTKLLYGSPCYFLAWPNLRYLKLYLKIWRQHYFVVISCSSQSEWDHRLMLGMFETKDLKTEYLKHENPKYAFMCWEPLI